MSIVHDHLPAGAEEKVAMQHILDHKVVSASL